MANTENLRRHAELMDRMATTLGLDLEEIMMSGRLQMDTLGDAVLGCTGCSNPDGCNDWLDRQNTQVDKAPGICRNAQLFELLKAGKSA